MIVASCLGNGHGGAGGAGRNGKAGVGGGGGQGNNNEKPHGEGPDGLGNAHGHCSRPALLGALALVTASAAFPAASLATPGSLLPFTSNSSSKASFLLSSSATSRSAGLSAFLDRTSLDGCSIAPPSGSSSASTSPGRSSRPRSKVLHVPCKGSTLVVPLTGNDGGAPEEDIALRRVVLPWQQRRRVVEAPVELSEREARLLASRQNRVRDSLLVQ